MHKHEVEHYDAIHSWVKKMRGKASFCAVNKDHIAKIFHWANISREYKREVDDWVSLCPSCHFKMDKRNKDIRLVLGWIIKKEKPKPYKERVYKVKTPKEVWWTRPGEKKKQRHPLAFYFPELS